MRSIWTGALSFGLVNIPVKVYPATEDRDFKFHYLHRKCHTPINYVKRCPTCEEDVEQDEIVRGYEYARGQYVVVAAEELAELPLPTTKAIEISDFVDLREIDPIYFSRPYYLAPGEGGQKAFALLHRAMSETGRAALAKVALRQRETLVAIRSFQQALLMETMLYADEIRRPEALPGLAPPPPPDPRELEMAKRLIDSLSASFEPARYEDNYRKALEELITAKIAGREVAVAPPPAPAKVVDLMEALRASIERAEAERRTAREGTGGAKPKRAAAKGRKPATAGGKR